MVKIVISLVRVEIYIKILLINLSQEENYILKIISQILLIYADK